MLKTVAYLCAAAVLLAVIFLLVGVATCGGDSSKGHEGEGSSALDKREENHHDG